VDFGPTAEPLPHVCGRAIKKGAMPRRARTEGEGGLPSLPPSRGASGPMAPW